MTLSCETSGYPADIACYDHGRRLLTSVWRKIVVGETDCPVTRRELFATCGGDAAAMHAAIVTFVSALAYAGRRRIKVGYPGCPGLSGDERQLLALLAAAQVNDRLGMEAHLRWLTRYDLRYAVVLAAEALAETLLGNGLVLAATPERRRNQDRVETPVLSVSRTPRGFSRTAMRGGGITRYCNSFSTVIMSPRLRMTRTSLPGAVMGGKCQVGTCSQAC